MKCPICKGHSLRKHQLEAELPTHQCHKCEGIWISASRYWKWLKTRDNLPDPPDVLEIPLPVEEAGQVKICPECRHILRRYQVWPNTKFYLERCGHCESVWFDRDECKYLRLQGEHDQVRTFFTKAWQAKIKEKEAMEWMRNVHLERFGEADYAKIREIRAWLWQHPNQATLTAYLTDKDPYKPVAR
ncbi:MAG: zf-TFIIB domain-containing protein [Chloroflexi bacterium]|nr:zf-TFIIB domain-containing protein [Chloroflexota bacterium]